MNRFRTLSSRRLATALQPLMASAVLLLGACTHTPQQGSADTALEYRESEQIEIDGNRLTPDVLYQLMTAEIAGQRGQLDQALKRYQRLASLMDDPQLAERTARIAVFARDDATALQAATRWAYLSPDDPEAHQLLAVLYIREQRLDEATSELRTLLRLPGDRGARLRGIANFLGREQDQDAALVVMKRLLEDEPDNADMHFAYALLALRNGSMPEARSSMNRALQLAPGNNGMVMAYLGVLQKQGEAGEALDWLRQQVDGSPDNTQLRLLYARLLAENARYDDARSEFETLLSKDADNIDVIFALGLVNLQTQRLQAASANFERLIDMGGHVEESHFYLGQVAVQQGDYDAAIGHLKQVGEIPLQFDAQLQIADLMARQERYVEARQQIQSIETDDAEQQQLLLRAEAELLAAQDRLREAMDLYNAALAENLNPDLLYSRAMLAERMDRLDILERDLLTLIEMQPENSQALNALGYTLADRTDRYQEAYDLIERALELSPNDFYILDSMGWVLYRMGRLEEAVDYLRRAMALRPDPEVAAHLGEVLWVMGEQKEASDIWDTALQDNPEHELLNDVIDRLRQR